MKRGSRNTSRQALEKARTLRSNMSISEHHFWQAVRKKGIGFMCKRQVPVGPYVMDFYFPEARLCVETDGEQHVYRNLADARRDAHLETCGIKTIRIPTLDLFDPTGVPFARWLKLVREECLLRSGRRY